MQRKETTCGRTTSFGFMAAAFASLVAWEERVALPLDDTRDGDNGTNLSASASLHSLQFVGGLNLIAITVIPFCKIESAHKYEKA